MKEAFQWFKPDRKHNRNADQLFLVSPLPSHGQLFPTKQPSSLLLHKFADEESMVNIFKASKVPKQEGVTVKPTLKEKMLPSALTPR